jgi:hypothetical protein
MAYNTPEHHEWKRALIQIIEQNIDSTKEAKKPDLLRIQTAVQSHKDVASTYQFMLEELHGPRRLHSLDGTTVILELDQHVRNFPKDPSQSPPRRAPSPPSGIQPGAQAAAQMTVPIHLDIKAQKVWVGKLQGLLAQHKTVVTPGHKKVMLEYLYENITSNIGSNPNDSAVANYNLVDTELKKVDSPLRIVTPGCDAYVELKTHLLQFPHIESKPQRDWRDATVQILVQGLTSIPAGDAREDLEYLYRHLTTDPRYGGARATHAFIGQTLVATHFYPLIIQGIISSLLLKLKEFPR